MLVSWTTGQRQEVRNTEQHRKTKQVNHNVKGTGEKRGFKDRLEAGRGGWDIVTGIPSAFCMPKDIGAKVAPDLKHPSGTLLCTQDADLEPAPLVQPCFAALRAGTCLCLTKTIGHFLRQTPGLWEWVWEDSFHPPESSEVRFLVRITPGIGSGQVPRTAALTQGSSMAPGHRQNIFG